MLYLAWRNITRRLGQSIITVLIASIAVLSVTTSFIVLSTLGSSTELTRERLGADIMVLPAGASTDASSVLFTAQPINVYLSETLYSEIAEIAGVSRATPQFFTQTVDQSCCSVVGVTRIVGIDSLTDFVIFPWISNGSPTELLPGEILLGSSSPNTPGGNVAILGNAFSVVGTIEPTGTSVDETIFMDINSARNLAAESPYLAGLWDKTDPLTSISCIMIDLEDNADAQGVADTIMETHPGTAAVTTSDIISNASSQMRSIAALSSSLVALLVVVATIALAGRFSALAETRKKELGLMRTMGIPVRRILSGLFLETGLMTSLSAIVGISCASVVAASAVSIMHGSFNLPGSTIPGSVYVAAAAFGLIFALLLNAAALAQPMIRLFRTDPQELLSKGDL